LLDALGIVALSWQLRDKAHVRDTAVSAIDARGALAINEGRNRYSILKDGRGAMDATAMLREFCDAVERQDGRRFANLFCEDGVYHDVFYG
jgi:hypothetical protein